MVVGGVGWTVLGDLQHGIQRLLQSKAVSISSISTNPLRHGAAGVVSVNWHHSCVHQSKSCSSCPKISTRYVLESIGAIRFHIISLSCLRLHFGCAQHQQSSLHLSLVAPVCLMAYWNILASVLHWKYEPLLYRMFSG